MFQFFFPKNTVLNPLEIRDNYVNFLFNKLFEKAVLSQPSYAHSVTHFQFKIQQASLYINH